MKKKYKHWDLLNELPEGWKITKNAGSPLHGYNFCHSPHSMFSGEQKTALVKIDTSVEKNQFLDGLANKKTEEIKKADVKEKQVIDENYRLTMNRLAREQLKHKLLADITMDLQICKIEGWNYKQYLQELKDLIDGFYFVNKNTAS